MQNIFDMKKLILQLSILLPFYLIVIKCRNKDNDQANDKIEQTNKLKVKKQTGNNNILKNQDSVNDKDQINKDNQKIKKENPESIIKNPQNKEIKKIERKGSENENEKNEEKEIIIEELEKIKTEVDINKKYVYIVDILSNKYFLINISKDETLSTLKEKIKIQENQILEINGEIAYPSGKFDEYKLKKGDIIKITNVLHEQNIIKGKKYPKISSKNLNHEKSIVKSKLSKKGFSWKRISKGLNIAIKCPNKKCKSIGDYIWIPLGFKEFNINVLSTNLFMEYKIRCPECGYEFEKDDEFPEIEKFGLYDCKYKIRGTSLKNKKLLPKRSNLKRIDIEEINTDDLKNMNVYSASFRDYNYLNINVKENKGDKSQILLLDDFSNKFYNIEIANQMTVNDLKKKIENEIGIPIINQTLKHLTTDFFEKPEEKKITELISTKIKDLKIRNGDIIRIENKNFIQSRIDSNPKKWPKLFSNDKLEVSINDFKENNRKITKVLKIDSLKPGVIVQGKCKKCKKEGFTNLGFDATKYDKTKYSQKNYFNLGVIVHKIPCFDTKCDGELGGVGDVSKFGAYKCSYLFELTSNIDHKDIAEQNYADEFRYVEIKKMNSDPNSVCIWSSCVLNILDKNELKANAISKGLNLAVKCSNPKCHSKGKPIWISQGLGKFGCGKLMTKEVKCPICNVNDNLSNKFSNQINLIGFGLYDCDYRILGYNRDLKKSVSTEWQKIKKGKMEIYDFPEFRCAYLDFYTK